MPITPGSIVILTEDTISAQGGVETRLNAGARGRVCKVMDFFCCVQLSGAGCRRIAKHRLQETSGSAPPCTSACTAGC
jgi:hypothetical protein